MLGAPRDASHKNAYERAKNLLHKVRVTHEIIEEGEAEDFAAEIERYMKRHGVI